MYNPLNTPRFTPFQQLRRLLKPGHTRFAHARIGGSRAPSLWIYACLCLETHPSQSPTPEPSPMPTQIVRHGQTTRRLLLLLLYLCAMIAFVPFVPMMPSDGLDPSWIFGLNYANKQQMEFGRDIVFTFGPYASMYTGAYSPATALAMFSGTAYLATVLWLGTGYLGNRNKGLVVLCLSLALLPLSRDALFFAVPVVTCLACLRVIERIETSYKPHLLLLVLFSALGLLPLIKGSFIFICAVVVLITAALFLIHRRPLALLISLLCPAISMVIFWVLSGQPLGNLQLYFTSMAPVVSGYTEAMATQGSLLELVAYLGSSAVVAYILLRNIRSLRLMEWAPALVFACYLFLALKAGFVRQDAGHTIIAFSALQITAALLYASASRSRSRPRSRVTLGILVIATVLVGITHFKSEKRDQLKSELTARNVDVSELKEHGTLAALQKLQAQIGWTEIGSVAFRALAPQPPTLPVRLDEKYSAALAYVNQSCKLPFELSGTVDIYAYQQACILAKDLKWAPRPLFQSYSVYTPDLAKLNEQHIRGAQTPETVVFRLQTIDNRYPSMDDGASWPALFDNYDAVESTGDWARLSRRSNIKAESIFTNETNGQFQLNDEVHIQNNDRPVFALIDIENTLSGKLISVLYKPSSLAMEVTLGDGSKHTYRVNANMLKSGFFISPQVMGTPDFYALARQQLAYKPANTIASFRITDPGWSWRTQYSVQTKEYVY